MGALLLCEILLALLSFHWFLLFWRGYNTFCVWLTNLLVVPRRPAGSVCSLSLRCFAGSLAEEQNCCNKGGERCIKRNTDWISVGWLSLTSARGLAHLMIKARSDREKRVCVCEAETNTRRWRQHGGVAAHRPLNSFWSAFRRKLVHTKKKKPHKWQQRENMLRRLVTKRLLGLCRNTKFNF